MDKFKPCEEILIVGQGNRYPFDAEKNNFIASNEKCMHLFQEIIHKHQLQQARFELAGDRGVSLLQALV